MTRQRVELELPMHSVARNGPPKLSLHAGVCSIAIDWAYDVGVLLRWEATFTGVEAIRATDLFSWTPDMHGSSKTAIVDMGSTRWLNRSKRGCADYGGEHLQHLRLACHEGLCFDLLCRDVTATARVEAVPTREDVG